MKYLAMTVLAGLCLLPLSSVTAQTPGRRPASRPPAARPVTAAAAPTPTPAPTPATAVVPATSYGPLATVNGQTITIADLDPTIATEMGNLGRKLAQARQQILELQVNTMLLELESQKRKLSGQQLYDLEVTKKIVPPTDLEIKQFIEANKDQIADSDPQNIKLQVAAFLHGEREERLSADFVRRLRVANPIVPGVDLNAANLNPAAVVVTVGGRPIMAGAISEKLKPIVYKLQLDNYLLATAALNRTIDDMLLIAEANKRSVGPEEIVRTEITEKLHSPSEAEIAKFYNENKAKINVELTAARGQIAAFLQQQEQERLEQALSDRMRKGAQIRMLLTEPAQPVQAIDIKGAASRGDLNARVTLVEFTDFECPSCAAMHPVLEEVLKSFGDRVRFVVRNYPLTRHPNARKAAEAGAAALAQGKFFEYTSLLFKRQAALDPASLKKYASELGLDRVRFDAELDGDKYAPAVRHDIDDAETYGVEGTPTIFINGVMLRDLSATGLHAAIDRALAAPVQPAK